MSHNPKANRYLKKIPPILVFNISWNGLKEQLNLVTLRLFLWCCCTLSQISTHIYIHGSVIKQHSPLYNSAFKVFLFFCSPIWRVYLQTLTYPFLFICQNHVFYVQCSKYQSNRRLDISSFFIFLFLHTQGNIFKTGKFIHFKNSFHLFLQMHSSFQYLI